MQRARWAALVMLAAVGLYGPGVMAQPPDYPLRHNDTVVFLGDSNTAGADFGKVIETFTLLRYPERAIAFRNAGIGGDTAAGGAARLERDVFDQGGTVVIVTFGLNDILWGAAADEAHRQAFLNGIRSILISCRDHVPRVRVILNSYPLTGGQVGQTQPNPTQQFLHDMALDAFAIAQQVGGDVLTIDVFEDMFDLFVNGRQTSPLWGPRPSMGDGIHLTPFGHQVWAWALLRNMNVSPTVSSVTLSAAPLQVVTTTNATVSGLTAPSGRIEFTRLDGGLPMNFGAFQIVTPLLWVPYTDELNRYLLKVTGLATGTYAIDVDGKRIGQWTATVLAAGVNLGPDTADAYWPTTPWGGKAWVIRGLTDARHTLLLNDGFGTAFAGSDPNLPRVQMLIDVAERKTVAAQRNMREPYGMRFVITRVP